SAEAAALVVQARETPELFARLLIPPGYPRSVSGAVKEVRVRAATVLGLSRDLRALQALVDSSVYDPEDAVRLTSAKALKLLEEPVAVRKLVDLAIAGDRQKYPWPVRRSACIALRRYGDVAAIERLLRELSYELAGGNPLDPKNRVRGVAAGLGTDNPLGLPDSPPDLQLSEQDLYPTLSAVKEVTGMSFSWGEKEAKTWLQWWRKEGPKFAFKD
ncbi:MAG: HEAT repeat domain-containing protein, partial [Planctomycetota bacterium]|nr:HEAT repeat domain-containing protein [Planctomycetota bacterium]